MAWINTTSALIIIIYKSIQQETIPNRELSRPKRTGSEDGTTIHNNYRRKNLQAVDTLNNKQPHASVGKDRETLARIINSNHLLSKTMVDQQHHLQQTLQQDMHHQELLQPQQLSNETLPILSAAEKIASDDNLTAVQRQMRHFWSRKKLLVEGQYAYMSNVFLICLMLACFWWMRGFHKRNRRRMVVSFNEEPNLTTVEEVLFRKAQFLSIFHHKKELQEVFVHDCGNDP